MKIYYLSSLDSYKFKDSKECIFIKNILSNPQFDVALIKINPCVIINNQEVSQLLITNRFEGDKLFPIKKFPMFVNILLPEMEKINFDKFELKDLPFIATSELYKSEEKARLHVFD